jgi:hypothetical protein
MPRKKKIITEDDSHLPMKERIRKRLEKLIGYELDTRYEHIDKFYEVLDICEGIDYIIEQTELRDILYLEMVCDNKLYSATLPLNYIIADIGEINEIEDLDTKEWASG